MTAVPDAPAAAAAPRLSRRKRLLFGAIVLVTILGGLELVSRWYLARFRGFDGRHLMQYTFDPYKNILPTPNYVDRRGIRHNAVGFRRSGEVSRQKPAGTYRVFLLGASTAYGLGGLWPHLDKSHPVLRNDETIDAFLERELAQRFPGARVEVINAAITSTWTHHHLIYLNQAILGYDPDMVLFLDGFNDFFMPDPTHDQFASYAYGMASHVVEGDPTLRALAYMNGWWLFRKSALAHLTGRILRTVKLVVRGRPASTPVDVPRFVEVVQRNFERNALKMHQRSGLILRQEGIATVFMLQPMLILERDRPGATPLEQRLFAFDVESTHPNYETAMRTIVPLVAAREAAMADSLGATFIDLTGIFRGVPGEIYTDYAHLTPHGNAVLAGVVADRITPLIEPTLGPSRAPAASH